MKHKGPRTERGGRSLPPFCPVLPSRVCVLLYSVHILWKFSHRSQILSASSLWKTWTDLFIIYFQLYSLVVVDISKHVNDIKMHYTVFTWKKELIGKEEWGSSMEEMEEVCVPWARDAPPPPQGQCSPVQADVRRWYLTITCRNYNFVLLRETDRVCQNKRS